MKVLSVASSREASDPSTTVREIDFVTAPPETSGSFASLNDTRGAWVLVPAMTAERLLTSTVIVPKSATPSVTVKSTSAMLGCVDTAPFT